MAENYTNIDTGIKDMVEQLTTLTADKIVLAEQNGVRPDLPYLSFERVSEQSMQRENGSSISLVDNYKTAKVKQSVIRFQSYSNTNREQYTILDDIVLGFENPFVMDTINSTYGFNVLNHGTVTDISTVTTQRYEYRAFLDFTIVYTTVEEFADTAGCIIEDVNGSGVLKDATLGDRNITFNVDT